MSRQAQQRFNLLLLGVGEYFFEDLGVNYMPPSSDSVYSSQTKVKGRLKLCSASLVFEPDSIRFPVAKYMFKNLTVLEPCKGLQEEAFLLRTSMVVDVKENNENVPFVFREVPGDHIFTLSYTSLTSVLPRIRRLIEISKLKPADQASTLNDLIEETERSVAFNSSWLEDGLMEQVLIERYASRVTPLVNTPGRLVVTSSRLYFQPFNNISAVPVHKCRLSACVHVAKRRHMLRQVGLELFFSGPAFETSVERTISQCGPVSLFFSFKSVAERDELFVLLTSHKEVKHLEEDDLKDWMHRWQTGAVSNFDYLMYLNRIAGRSFQDLTQYPVFPWVIADYTSKTLDLNSPASFRDLSKPIGALNPKRLALFQKRYEDMPEPRFLYGTHYSSPAYVLYYLTRSSPEFMLCLQNGKFDSADRLFDDLADTWNSVNNNPADLKELIPEFYDSNGDFFLNLQGLNLGLKQNGLKVEDVALPPWAKDASQVVKICRQALESSYVSEHLHLWIDLIFGCKQRGQAALDANNLFYYLTYEGAVDLDSIADATEKESLKAQIMEFGQTPTQVLKSPHPQRSAAPLASLSPSPATAVSEPVLADGGEVSPATSAVEPSPQASAESVADAAGDGGGAQVGGGVDATSFSCIHSFKGRDSITVLCFSQDGNTLYAGGQDSSLRIYDLQEKRQLRCFNVGDLALSSLCVPPAGNSIIAGSWDNNIYVYSVDYGRVQDENRAHDDAVSAMQMCGNLLISGSWDGSVKVWKFNGGVCGKTPVAQLIEHETEVKCVSLSEDGELAASGAMDGTVIAWDVRSESVKFTLAAHSDEVTVVRFVTLFRKQRLLSASQDGTVRVWNIDDGGVVFVLNCQQPVRSVDLLRDTQLLAGTQGGVVQVWALVAAGGGGGSLKGELAGHTGAVTCVNVCERSSEVMMATASEDSTVRLWR